VEGVTGGGSESGQLSNFLNNTLIKKKRNSKKEQTMSNTCDSFIRETYTTDGTLHIIRYASSGSHTDFMQIYDLDGNRILEFPRRNIIYTRNVGPISEHSQWVDYANDRIKKYESAIMMNTIKVIIHDAINNTSEMVVVEY